MNLIDQHSNNIFCSSFCTTVPSSDSVTGSFSCRDKNAYCEIHACKLYHYNKKELNNKSDLPLFVFLLGK